MLWHRWYIFQRGFGWLHAELLRLILCNRSQTRRLPRMSRYILRALYLMANWAVQKSSSRKCIAIAAGKGRLD